METAVEESSRSRFRAALPARRTRILQALALSAVVALSTGCGSNETATETRTEGQVLTDLGWTAFAEGRTTDATELFEDALAVDPLYADAENGLGWVSLAFGLYTEADAHFARAMTLGLDSQEAQAGHAFVAELLGDYDEALAASGRVLAAAPRFVFSRRAGIDFRDLRLLRARARIADGEFLLAKAELDVIDPANNVNPGSETFVDDLLEQIELFGERLSDF
jgi:tetratricopeptide (TPR) repeat protein